MKITNNDFLLSVKYEFVTKSPLHTSSDKDTGTTKTFNREPIQIKESIVYDSIFSKKERQSALATILISIYKSIDSDYRKKRQWKIWDEFGSKIYTATQTDTKKKFLNKICQLFGIRALKDLDIKLFEYFTDDEFLETIRNEYIYLVMIVRLYIQEKNEAYKNKETIPALFDLPDSKIKENKKKEYTFTKYKEAIPSVHGNSIRGKLRDIVMEHYVKFCGIEKMSKIQYWQLFSGGNITESTAYEDLDKRNEMIKLCPMLGLLGAAIGNMTITGNLKVSSSQPKCKELGNGEQSLHTMLHTEFMTRKDDSKTEKVIELVSKDKKDKKKNPAIQMKYEIEVINKGVEFEHKFTCEKQIGDTAFNSVGLSAFWFMLKCFKDNPYICGLGRVGFGELDLSDLEIPEGACDLYLNHIEKYKDEARKYFSIKEKGTLL